MLTSKDWTDRLKYLEGHRTTYYDNSFPGNCGLIYNGGAISFDCIGMVKSVINYPDIVYKTSPAGFYVTPGQVIGDIAEIDILNECSDVVWGNFANCVNGEYLYMSGHAGVYFSGNPDVNVIECSPAWRGGVMCSWVDPDGTRRSWRQGEALGRWEAHGKLSRYISYGTADGLQYVNGKWVYIKNGKVDTSYNGVAQNQYGWWKCKNGEVDFNFSGLAQNEHGWWYCKNGQVDFSFNGLCQLGKSWWLCKNGGVDFGFTGLYQNYDKKWWYVKKGQIDFTFNGVVKNDAGNWLVVKNQVDFDYNGLAQNEKGTWMMFQGGKFVKDYNGLVPNKYGTWVVKNGYVNFKANGKYHFSGHDFKVKDGCVK